MAKKPVKIDSDLMHKIADRLAVGETLKDILKADSMPTYQGVMQAVLICPDAEVIQPPASRA